MAWRVKWNYDFDTPRAAAELGGLVPALKGPLGVLTHVKKNFPAAQQRDAAQLSGGTTFGYDPNVPGSGSVTPNVIRMTTSADATGVGDGVAAAGGCGRARRRRQSGSSSRD